MSVLTPATIFLTAFSWEVGGKDLCEARNLTLVIWFMEDASLGFIMAFDDGRPRAILIVGIARPEIGLTMLMGQS